MANQMPIRSKIDTRIPSAGNQPMRTLTEAIRLFLAQVKLREGLPFEVRTPTDNRDVLLSPASRQSALDSVFDD